MISECIRMHSHRYTPRPPFAACLAGSDCIEWATPAPQTFWSSLPHAGSLCGEERVPSGLSRIRHWNEEEGRQFSSVTVTYSDLSPPELRPQGGLALTASLTRTESMFS